ncbi:unnamed protein product [Ranitomeya imitator]|uniref:Dopamine beta-hydroxylase n=1 Tax=Ranitomeya imitator TaxID=111125 RepID=A0ABN9LS41_9NEOB|nr:unnamed protein product [Ranitomeya imitator]
MEREELAASDNSSQYESLDEEVVEHPKKTGDNRTGKSRKKRKNKAKKSKPPPLAARVPTEGLTDSPLIPLSNRFQAFDDSAVPEVGGEGPDATSGVPSGNGPLQSASSTVTAGRKVKAEHSGCAFTFTLRPAVTECGKQTARDLTDTRMCNGRSSLQAFYYPDDVGLAFGGPRSSRFLRLEVHYHNPLELKGLRDSSGIRLHYTPSLRKYDAGIMELGLVYTPVMAIPPHQREFSLTGYCTGKCTDLALPSGGIHIFASQLHTHLTGRAVTTMLVRDQKEMAIVNEDKHFSPHFQEIRMLKKPVQVLPVGCSTELVVYLASQGDLLITRCSYNTEDRSKVTVGGFSITDEMCVNYIHYYPRTDLELCKSHVDLGYLKKYFNLVNRFSGEEVCTCPQSAVTEQFNEVPWSSFTSEVLDSLYRYSPISMHCNKSSAVRFPGQWEKQPLPVIKEALAPKVTSCPPQEVSVPAGPAIVTIKNWGYH